MMRLQELQRQFTEAVFSSDANAADALKPWIKTAAPLTSTAHLGIYRGSVQGQLAQALEELFPVCRALVGEHFFSALSRPYIVQHPSRSPDIGEFGACFADHIDQFEGARDLPYLSDVARLETAWHQVFNGADKDVGSDGLDLDALGRVPPEQQEQLCFQLPPASRLLRSDYPVHRIWQTNQPDYQGNTKIALDSAEVRLLIWRSGSDIHLDPLQPDEWQVLRQLRIGTRLKDLGTPPDQSTPTVNIAALLPQMLARGWIAGFTLAET